MQKDLQLRRPQGSPQLGQIYFEVALQYTVVGLSTRPAFLITFHFFQIQNFLVLQQAFSYKNIHVKQEKWI